MDAAGAAVAVALPDAGNRGHTRLRMQFRAEGVVERELLRLKQRLTITDGQKRDQCLGARLGGMLLMISCGDMLRSIGWARV